MVSSVALRCTVPGTPQQCSFPSLRLHGPRNRRRPHANDVTGRAQNSLPRFTPRGQRAPVGGSAVGFLETAVTRALPRRRRLGKTRTPSLPGRRHGDWGCSISVSRFGRIRSRSSLPQRLRLGKGDSGSRDGSHRLGFHVHLGRSCPRRRSSESACLFSDATFR